VSAGVAHTVAVAPDGSVHTWGDGKDGRLGHGQGGAGAGAGAVGGEELQHKRVPTRVEGLLVGLRVVGVSAGGLHTVVVTDAGLVYVWGLGCNGQVGDGGLLDRHDPTLISGALLGKRVVGRDCWLVLATSYS